MTLHRHLPLPPPLSLPLSLLPVRNPRLYPPAHDRATRIPRARSSPACWWCIRRPTGKSQWPAWKLERVHHCLRLTNPFPLDASLTPPPLGSPLPPPTATATTNHNPPLRRYGMITQRNVSELLDCIQGGKRYLKGWRGNESRVGGVEW